MLDRIGDEKARCTTVVEYQPHSKFPEHTHIGGEEFLVLKGTFHDQFGRFPEGTYVRNPIGSKHSPWVEEDGCTILVKLLQMADTKDLTEPLYIHTNQAKVDAGIATEFGTLLELYQNEITGEHVQMLWIDPEKVLPISQEAVDGGEELFIVNGSLQLTQEEVYAEWGWLRFPVGSDAYRSNLRAGKSGAQVYRKMGHLTEKALGMEKIQINDDETFRVLE